MVVDAENLYKKEVKISLEDLMLLCLNVDYSLNGEDAFMRDAVEDVSVRLQQKFKFCTHDFRVQLRKASE